MDENAVSRELATIDPSELIIEAVMVGQTISHYRVLEKLGQGGMGVVYKAEDKQLRRTVALKFLSSETISNEEVKNRLIREAQASASLDHPNICAVHGIHEEQGQTFIAMAFIDGPSLTDKIKERPLPLGEALDIAIQIAAGLQAAHEKGIVHRDIKPANVMITAQGQVKIMDFGMAQLSNRTKLTATGMKLGTPAYMSPEQTEGKRADRRTDLWALGVLLYEMVSGRVPFPGGAEAAVAYAILHTEPEPLTALRSGLPMELDRIVAKTLAKHANDRYQYAADLLVDLRGFQRTLHTGSRDVPSRKVSTEKPSVGWQARAGWLVATATFMGALALLWNNWSTNPPETPLTRFHFSVGPSADALASVFWQPRVALSPDGSRVAFVANQDGIPLIYVRQLSTYEAVPVSGTDGAHSPFFSPDGEWIAFFTSTQLKKVSLGSGAVVSICDTLPVAMAGTWGPDDTILFSPSPASALARVPARGGVPQQSTELAAGEKAHLFPTVLPGGGGLLYTVRGERGWFDTSIAALSLQSGERKTLLEAGSSPRYVSSGHLVYAHAGALLAVPFDLGQLETKGPPVRIVEGVRTAIGADFSVSDSGTLAYIPGDGASWLRTNMAWVDLNGQSTLLDLRPGRYNAPRLSHEGNIVVEVLSMETGNVDIWVGEPSRPLTRFTFNPDVDEFPVWSPDGNRIAFSKVGGHSLDVSWKSADGASPERPLSQLEFAEFPTSWSSNGLLFTYEHPETKLDLWHVPSEGNQEPQPLLETAFNEAAAAFSPDGRWIAYQSDESGQYEVYVVAFPKTRFKRTISTRGGVEPVWARDGSELYYRQADKIMAVAVERHATFSAGAPRFLFEASVTEGRVSTNYDVGLDGRFLIVQPHIDGLSNQINIVLNWVSELRRLVPVEHR